MTPTHPSGSLLPCLHSAPPPAPPRLLLRPTPGILFAQTPLFTLALDFSKVHFHCLQTCTFNELVYTILGSFLKRHRKKAIDVLPQNASNRQPNSSVGLASREEEGVSLQKGLPESSRVRMGKERAQSCSLPRPPSLRAVNTGEGSTHSCPSVT